MDIYKENESDRTGWIETDAIGEYLFTLDGGKTVHNLFEDYPDKLTKEEKEIFDKENPDWADFFKSRQS